MRIIVCVKQVLHIYARTGRAPETNFLAREDSIYRINPYDELAVCMAVLLKEQASITKVNLLTLGPMVAEQRLRHCLAMGADHIYNIPMPDSNIDPWIKSICLARAIAQIGADIVLCGKESLDTRNAQVPAAVARQLKMPFVSCIRDISIGPESNTVKVQRSAGRGIREVIECKLPAVFSVEGPTEVVLFPPYARKKKSEAEAIHKIILAEPGIYTPKQSVMRTFPPRPRPKKAPVPDSKLDAFYRIDQLLSGTHVEKKGEILTGNPEFLADKIISFLKEQGLLEDETNNKETG